MRKHRGSVLSPSLCLTFGILATDESYSSLGCSSPGQEPVVLANARRL